MESICGSSGSMMVFLIVRIILTTIITIVPIVVIVNGSINMYKAVQSGKAEDIKKGAKQLAINIIAGLIVLIIPPIFSYIFTNIIEGKGEQILTCINTATIDKVNAYKEKEQQEAKDKKKQEEQEAQKISEEMQKERKEEIEETKKNSNNRRVLSKEGNSDIKPVSKGDDRYEITIGNVTYQIVGQNESSFSGERLRDGRTFSTGGCGPTALTTALSSFGYKGDPVEVNQAGSDVSVESHVKAIETLQANGKLDKNVKVISHPKSSLPSNADDFYQEVRDALSKGHAVLMDIREGSKKGNNFCNIYGTGDYFDNEGAIHAHWTTIAAYDPANDNALFANTCGSRQWASLKKIMDLTHEAVIGKVYSDESGWVGSWVEIYK